MAAPSRYPFDDSADETVWFARAARRRSTSFPQPPTPILPPPRLRRETESAEDIAFLHAARRYAPSPAAQAFPVVIVMA